MVLFESCWTGDGSIIWRGIYCSCYIKMDKNTNNYSHFITV